MAMDTTLICKRTRVWWGFSSDRKVVCIGCSRFLAKKGWLCETLAVVRGFSVWNTVVRNREVATKLGFLMYYSDRDAVRTQGKWPL